MSLARALLLAGSFAVSVAIVAGTLLGADAWSSRQRVWRDLQAIRQTNAASEQEVAALARHVEALKQRHELQEQVIRDELGYVKTGEIILRLPDETPAAAAAPPASVPPRGSSAH